MRTGAWSALGVLLAAVIIGQSIALEASDSDGVMVLSDDAQDDVEAAFAQAMQEEEADEQAANKPTKDMKKVRQLKKSAKQAHKQKSVNVSSSAERAGAKILAQKQLPTLVAAAQHKQAKALDATRAKQRKAEMAGRKVAEAKAAKVARHQQEVHAKAFVKKREKKKAKSAHEEAALKVELKGIQTKKKKAAAAQKAALKKDKQGRHMEKKGKAESHALKTELGHMEKDKVKMMKTMKHNIEANLKKQAANAKAKTSHKKPIRKSAEKVLKAELVSIQQKKAQKIAAAHEKLALELAQAKNKAQNAKAKSSNAKTKASLNAFTASLKAQASAPAVKPHEDDEDEDDMSDLLDNQ